MVLPRKRKKNLWSWTYQRLSGTSNEEGLLCVVKSPDFEKDKNVYIYYSNKYPRKSVISRFVLRDHKIDQSSEEKIIEIPNHMPTTMADSWHLDQTECYILELVMVDQRVTLSFMVDLENVHGSILRLDVLGQKTYKIPEDNSLSALVVKLNQKFLHGDFATLGDFPLTPKQVKCGVVMLVKTNSRRSTLLNQVKIMDGI